MAINYTKLAATAKRLIEANGRKLIMLRPSEVAADTAKPWDGPAPATADTEFAISGVFVPPNTVRQFGLTALGTGHDFLEDLIQTSEQMCITFPGETDLAQFTHMKDGTVDWNVIGIQVLKPGNVTLLAFIGVKR